MRFQCQGCQSTLEVDGRSAGKRGKCPKCGASVQVPSAPPQSGRSRAAPATEAQRQYASSLGVDFPDSITKKDMTELITEAENRRARRIEELSERESSAYEELREQVVHDLDDEDCRLSKATHDQIVQELCDRGEGAILISFDPRGIDFDELKGKTQFTLSFSDNLSEADVCAVVLTLRDQAAGRLMELRGVGGQHTKLSAPPPGQG